LAQRKFAVIETGRWRAKSTGTFLE